MILYVILPQALYNGFLGAALEPAVDFARVDEVLLVTGDTRHDLAAHFPTGG